jgi:hypothetical protein
MVLRLSIDIKLWGDCLEGASFAAAEGRALKSIISSP